MKKRSIMKGSSIRDSYHSVSRMTFTEFNEKITGTSLQSLHFYFLTFWDRYNNMFLPFDDPYELNRRRFIFLTNIEASFQDIFYNNEKFKDCMKMIEELFVKL